ncbi:MAG: hypothetical protein SAJ37_00105 [Oscillatoria sp. PMC 1068.18]|nr:hypothetical protein [Oscillatoria sp. PMC 1076.18]MEC4987122.1 hypothetical protein [Oscillatoria sp. PMC 1068.18]
MKKITATVFVVILMLGFAPQIIATNASAALVCVDKEGSEYHCPD